MHIPDSSNGRTRSFGLRNVSSTLTLGTFFVGLNLADAFLTNAIITMGTGIEGNPVTVGYGANVITKVIIAIAVVVILALFKKLKLLKVLNWCFTVVVLWNLSIYILGVINGL